MCNIMCLISFFVYAKPCRLQTALHKAAWFGYKDICKILIEKGASPRRTDYQYNTPYDKAIQSGDIELQEYLKRKLCSPLVFFIKNTSQAAFPLKLGNRGKYHV